MAYVKCQGIKGYNMWIDISKYRTVFLLYDKNLDKEIEENLHTIIKLGNELGFLNGHQLSDWIHNQLIIKNDSVILPPHWSKEFCKNGGILKRPFIDIQLLLYELRELFESGKFDIRIFVNGVKFIPNFMNISPRLDRDTKKMIKWYKKKYKVAIGNCDVFKIMPNDECSQLCCLCGNREKLLLKKEV